jgi:transcriptional regulator GlxA family with amidase domain
VLTTLERSAEALLDNPAGEVRSSVEFDERLREHDRSVTPALTFIRRSAWTMIEIAEYVGFGSRTSLFRHLKAFGGVAPRQLLK